jgi:hypothetical protein
MAKQLTKTGARWSKEDDQHLKMLAKQNTPTRVIALKLRRTPAAVQGHASRIGLSLKPINQSPYSNRNDAEASAFSFTPTPRSGVIRWAA